VRSALESDKYVEVYIKYAFGVKDLRVPKDPNILIGVLLHGEENILHQGTVSRQAKPVEPPLLGTKYIPL
jgi:hypothetical protein